MKNMKIILLFLALTGFVKLNAQTTPVFKFEKTTIDYGTIKQGSDGYRTFVFTNTGDAPIIVSQVTSSCGCTIPEKPKEPIMPGEKGSLKVHYDTNRVGPFQKNIRITSNAKPTVVEIHIKGLVVKKTD
ncbi:MAG: DUF1573 domain-containing protein [Flavobacteriaceae bacterium]